MPDFCIKRFLQSDLGSLDGGVGIEGKNIVDLLCRVGGPSLIGFVSRGLDKPSAVLLLTHRHVTISSML